MSAENSPRSNYYQTYKTEADFLAAVDRAFTKSGVRFLDIRDDIDRPNVNGKKKVTTPSGFLREVVKKGVSTNRLKTREIRYSEATGLTLRMATPLNEPSVELFLYGKTDHLGNPISAKLPDNTKVGTIIRYFPTSDDMQKLDIRYPLFLEVMSKDEENMYVRYYVPGSHHVTLRGKSALLGWKEQDGSLELPDRRPYIELTQERFSRVRPSKGKR